MLETINFSISTEIYDRNRKKTFKIVRFNEIGIFVEHVPEFKNLEKGNDEFWEYQEILDLFKKKKLIINGYNYLTNLEHFERDVINVKNEYALKKIEEQNLELQNASNKLERVENLRKKRREEINKTINEKSGKRKEILEEMKKEKQLNEYLQRIELIKEQISESISNSEILKLNEELELISELYNNLKN